MSQQATNESTQQVNEPEICIWIDKYDDVFSEFDSRPFSDRALSDDFLREVQKMTTQNPTRGAVRLKFAVMEDQRNVESEAIIINNLNQHFRHIADDLRKDQDAIRRRGYVFMGVGFVLISFIFLLTTMEEANNYLQGIILMLEPIGWFTTWTGLDYVFQLSRKEKSAIDFNNKMATAKITFSSLDDAQDTNSKQKTVIPLDNQNLRVA